MRRLGKRDSGVALLTAIVILAIATSLAVAIAFRSALSARRLVGNNAIETALQAGAAAEAFAAWGLREDGGNNDDLTESWAQRVPPFEVTEGVTVEGQIQDLDGRFNINSLLDDTGAKDPIAYELFERLLLNLQLDVKFAALALDFIDADTQPEASGGEDSLYSGFTPPYRPPNRPVTSISELMALPGLTGAMYDKLAPHVSALPRNEKAINTCTASGPLLDAWTNQGQWTRAPEALQRLRQSGCYPNDTQTQQLFNANPADYQKVKDRIKTQSRYFQLRTLVTIGTQEFALYSLLQRASSATGGKPEIRVVTRTLAE